MSALKAALWPQALLNRPVDASVSKETFLKLLGVGVHEEVVLDLAVRAGTSST